MNSDQVQDTSVEITPEAVVDVKFSDLSLPEPILRALLECGYEYPTTIQAQAIPQLLAGHDLIGGSQTGTGKTAAFLLPILAKLHLKKVQELADRVGTDLPDDVSTEQEGPSTSQRVIPMAAEGGEGYSLSEPSDGNSQPSHSQNEGNKRRRPRRRKSSRSSNNQNQQQAQASDAPDRGPRQGNRAPDANGGRHQRSGYESSRERSPRRQHNEGPRSHSQKRPAGGQYADRQHSQSTPQPSVLILEPTRELATQVFDSFQRYAKYLNIKAALLYGGVGYGLQRQQLDQGADIIIATPGRLMDMIEQRSLSLKGVDTLVLDEADRMLDMGFMPAVRKIVSYCPKERQSLLFSATLSPEIASLSKAFLKNPVEIKVGGGTSLAETINHGLYPVDERQKFDLLRALLEHLDYKSVLIFTRMKIGADIVSRWLENHGHAPVAVLHADRSQKEREQALNDFKSGKCQILVATDIVARGIDISGITHVINYDVPQHPEDYVHRIGRTGRAKREGDAVTIFTATEVEFVASIERLINQRIERRKLPGFNYNWTPILEDRAPAKKKRNRGFQRPAF